MQYIACDMSIYKEIVPVISFYNSQSINLWYILTLKSKQYIHDILRRKTTETSKLVVQAGIGLIRLLSSI